MSEKKKPRNMLKDMKIDEVSLVPAGANQGARQVIAKIGTGITDEVLKATFDEAMAGIQAEEVAEDFLDDMWAANRALRESIRSVLGDASVVDKKAAILENLRQFILATSTMVNESALSTALQKAAGKTEGGKQYPESDYAFVPDPAKPSTWKLRLTAEPGGPPDASIVGAAVAALGDGFRGNKVVIPADKRAEVVARVKQAWLKANPGKGEQDVPAVLKSIEKTKGHQEEEAMKNQVEALQKKLDEVTERLAKSEFRSALTEDGRAHFDKLDEAGKTSFMKMDETSRLTAIEKSSQKEEVLVVEGQSIRKSDIGDAAFIILKSQQERLTKQEATLAAERELRIQKELETEAETLFPNLPGSPVEKAKLLKAAKGDEGQMSILKAANEAAKTITTELGHSVQKGENDPLQKLEKMASERAASDKISFHKAYELVLETAEGKALYSQTIKR